MVVVLKPIHDAARIERVVVSTYQSVSGAGQKGIRQLERESQALSSGSSPISCQEPHRHRGLARFGHIDRGIRQPSRTRDTCAFFRHGLTI